MSDTKKIVINACFGGFSLSADAQRRLVGCGHVQLIEPREYYGDRYGWEQRFARDSAADFCGVTVHDGKIVSDDHRDGAARSCARLVDVVEGMGTAANGECASLRVVEIPADVEYEIEEYDGNEHIAESHRTWR